jgi:hypothetical protein
LQKKLVRPDGKINIVFRQMFGLKLIIQRYTIKIRYNLIKKHSHPHLGIIRFLQTRSMEMMEKAESSAQWNRKISKSVTIKRTHYLDYF